MTRAEMILSLLREHPRTFEELTSLTGLSDPIVRTTLSDLRRNGYMAPVPTTYIVTPKGDKAGKPKIDWNAQRAIKDRPIKPRSSTQQTETMVQKSIKTNANSVFSMGAMNA